jgi:uncharacterized protein involved in exopolysaccharide biosynthesis
MFMRRRLYFAVSFILIFSVVIGYLLTATSIYRSTGRIIVENQTIPEGIVPSLIDDYVNRRIDNITQKIMLTENLIDIANRFNLYPELKKQMRMKDIARKIREDIEISIINASPETSRGGRPDNTALAFNISFSYHNPEIAKQVADELISLYLARNLEERRAVASQTTDFLARERAQLEEKIAELEQELTRFKTENQDYLPDEVQFARQRLATIEQQLLRLERESMALKEREAFLKTQLAFTEEYDTPGGTALTPASQLEVLRAELASARARYTPNHPDVVRLERELASMGSVVAGSSNRENALAQREAELTAELARLRERYTDDHPDVQRVQRELAAAREVAASGGAGASGIPRNQAYVQLSSQLNSTETEIGATEEQRAQFERERERLQEKLARAPVVQREYDRLNRALENAIADRESLADKETTAQLSGALESRAVSERFVIGESPTVPRGPVSPRTKLVLALGLVLATTGGGLSVFTAEFLDRSIRSPGELATVLGDAPLVAIPNILSPRDLRRVWLVRITGVGIVLVLCTGGVFYINSYVTPLDVLAFEAQNWTELWILRVFGGGAS